MFDFGRASYDSERTTVYPSCAWAGRSADHAGRNKDYSLQMCIRDRFGELKKMLKPITNTALTNALKELEADDLIQRIQYNEMPLRVEYSLTLKGQDLLPVFYSIMQWGIKYIP